MGVKSTVKINPVMTMEPPTMAIAPATIAIKLIFTQLFVISLVDEWYLGLHEGGERKVDRFFSPNPTH